MIRLLKMILKKRTAHLALNWGFYWLFNIYRKLINIQNGGLQWLNRSQNFDFQIALSYFISDFDQVCGRLDCLIRACISGSLAFNVAVPFNLFNPLYTQLLFMHSSFWYDTISLYLMFISLFKIELKRLILTLFILDTFGTFGKQ